jgi:hypothetical protein
MATTTSSIEEQPPPLFPNQSYVYKCFLLIRQEVFVFNQLKKQQ